MITLTVLTMKRGIPVFMINRIDEIRAMCRMAANIVNKSLYGNVDYGSEYTPVILSLKDIPYLLDRLAEAETEIAKLRKERNTVES